MSLNRYAYVYQNPINLIDPSGLNACNNPIRPTSNLFCQGGNSGSGSGRGGSSGRSPWTSSEIIAGVLIIGGVVYIGGQLAGEWRDGQFHPYESYTQGGAPGPQQPFDWNAFAEIVANASETIGDIGLDAEEWARICNEGWCGLGVLRWLFSQLGINIQTSTRVGEAKRTREDDCLGSQEPVQAAQEYAYKARDIYDTLSDRLGGNPPAVIAVTRVRENSNSECKYYVGINNGLSVEENTAARRTHLNRARDRVAGVSMEVLNQLSVTVFGAKDPLRTGSGPQYHAEYNLYNGLGLQGIPVVAIGISKRPCGNCNQYFGSLEFPVALRYAQ